MKTNRESAYNRKKTLLLLHLLLMMYSLSGIFSKYAGNSPLFSARFIICYGVVILLLGIYAIGWQQIIKKMPLTTAFANKAVTVVWGIIWGVLFFHESITIGKLVGAGLVIAGVVLYAKADGEHADE